MQFACADLTRETLYRVDFADGVVELALGQEGFDVPIGDGVGLGKVAEQPQIESPITRHEGQALLDVKARQGSGKQTVIGLGGWWQGLGLYHLPRLVGACPPGDNREKRLRREGLGDEVVHAGA